MTYRVETEYSEELIRLAARYFLRRFLLPEVVIGGVMVFAAAVALMADATPVWLSWTAGGLGFMLIAISAFVASRSVRAAREKFAMMGNGRAVWTFSETTLGTKSELGMAEIPWRLVTKVWCFPEVWLLFFGTAGYSTLPTAALSPELQAFILSQVRAGGGKVT